MVPGLYAKYKVVKSYAAQMPNPKLFHARAQHKIHDCVDGQPSKVQQIVVMWCDNRSAMALASNPVFHARIRTNHFEIDYHFIKYLHKKLSSFQLSYPIGY